ncbi:hypothetical protein BBF96_05160 [Anoxybacter fermentans]|uniref:Uncharacterized protein n=1 Tax=Anoxybacter fermentans TaxID=1323375 RepID=A0A3S9SX12_9FIRM|nr:hypothetical protein [Anoxybacter fermentans]AZR72831.1 hypothetical protein BBF96_05160 [Anoxybacter fermentans]
MKKIKSKKIPMKQILNMTKELSPDDLEVGELEDFQTMIEQKDDYSPDDDLINNSRIDRLGK